MQGESLPPLQASLGTQSKELHPISVTQDESLFLRRLRLREGSSV
ncbi:hypothetical protein THOG11_70021 [Vibrio harveyi]|nr:hypothetical protein TH15OA1_460020 [Vibrio harveyi]CAH1545365.1 hypothetical protein VHARVF571_600064 [Vibrio harveyi]CAH1585465.1 hypothetical protein THOG11_70021 [Vibrio harveyi]